MEHIYDINLYGPIRQSRERLRRHLEDQQLRLNRLAAELGDAQDHNRAMLAELADFEDAVTALATDQSRRAAEDLRERLDHEPL